MSKLYLSQFFILIVIIFGAPACQLNGFHKTGSASSTVVPTTKSASSASRTAKHLQNVAPAYATPSGSSYGLEGYKLGNGDRVQVTVFGEQALSGQYLVDGTGNIAMPLISQVSVGGLTAAEAQQTIAQQLRNGYLRRPNVAVQVVNYRPFFILGEVRRSGQYPFVSGMNIQTAVAIAGGFTPRARASKFKVTRPGQQGTREMLLKPSARVMPGDTIIVSERFF